MPGLIELIIIGVILVAPVVVGLAILAIVLAVTKSKKSPPAQPLDKP